MAMMASQQQALHLSAISAADRNRTLVFLLLLMGMAWSPAEVRAQSGEPLVLFCWRGYVPETVTNAFTKETGVQVVVEHYNSNEELLRYRLVDRRFDLVQPSDYALETLIDRNALEPLRHERIPNLTEYRPQVSQAPSRSG